MWNPLHDVQENDRHDIEVSARHRPPVPTTGGSGPALSTVRASTDRGTGVSDQHGLRPLHRWTVPPLNGGRCEEGAALPALVTQIGLVATQIDENIYSTTYQHVDGAALEGSHRYEIRFDPGELADADQFWSLTMYGLDCDLAEKRIDRYSVGDRTPWLRTDDGGGMTLVLQHERPDDSGVRNWLPAPEGQFCLVFRAYGPGPSVIDGAWAP
ncbi:MAG TPA: DUF1214 domain-containing protein, partial [Acidimicrobiales bacterium]